MAHFTARFLISLTALTAVAPFVVDIERPSEPAPRSSTATTAPPVVGSPPHPAVSVRGATADDRLRLEEALTRFEDAGLDLPELVVVFSIDEADCSGHSGRFRSSTTPWQISICADNNAVYEHELAHAWERKNLTDDRRDAFMALRGYDVWSGADVPWNRRGVEGAAFVVQQGLAGVPLAPALSNEARSRMEAYELLTGRPAPRLIRWMSDRDVECADRPTPLSHGVPDAAGVTCP
jgi:hypothetical protein